jgi:hypothetical protein
LQPGDQDKQHASSAPKRQTRNSVRQEGKSNSRKLTPGSNSQQFQESSTRKEGYSRQIQGFKQFQDLADWTRKKTQGGIQGAQRPCKKAKQKPVVHSDQAVEGGQIQLTILFYSIVFID